MFQFRAFPSYAYLIQRTIPEYCSGGFPHSEISGSTDICSSPKLIAACHVLHRLLMPRHSPCALYSLTKEIQLVLLNYAGNQQVTSQNCNCTHIFSDVPQLNVLQTSFNFRWKTSLLPCFSSHSSLFSFQGANSSLFWNQIETYKPLSASIHLQFEIGGDSRDRTGDLLLARQALSQLSYIPRPSSGYVYPVN